VTAASHALTTHHSPLTASSIRSYCGDDEIGLWIEKRCWDLDKIKAVRSDKWAIPMKS
jgi:hypothetical protein